MNDTPPARDDPSTLGPEDIAADDAGGGALGRNADRTAGGGDGFVPPVSEEERRQGEIAADDAGATARTTPED